MTYPGVRRAGQRETFDRETWAQFDRAIYNMRLEGVGEYLMQDPLYFGRAYDRPPFFTYSAVRQQKAGTEDVYAIGRPHHAVIGAIATRSHCLYEDQYFNDGSFEHQMLWSDPVIPTWAQTSWTNYQKIEDEQGGSYSYPRYPANANGWVQEPKKTLWTITGDQSFTDHPGYKGDYSATYTFDTDPESPWLLPIYSPAAEDQPYKSFGLSAADRWKGCWSHAIQINVDGFGWYLNAPAWSPKQGEHRYTVHTYSDGSCQLEAHVLWWGTDGVNRWDWGEQTETFDVQANVWNEHEFLTTVPGYIYPNYPNIGQQASVAINAQWGISPDTNFATVRFRITGGAAGQKAYIDEVWGMPRLRPTTTPMITIGVAEWVKDDHDMYIGARLWFRVENEGAIIS